MHNLSGPGLFAALLNLISPSPTNRYWGIAGAQFKTPPDMYFEPAAFFMARSRTREDVLLKPHVYPQHPSKIFGFVYRQSRNEMLEDKRPGGFQPQRPFAGPSKTLCCDRQRREQSRIHWRGRTNLPVDRLCSILLRAIRSRLRMNCKIP